MAKKTLLELTQDILSDMDSDYVNSIGESVEAEQVSNIIKNTYLWMINDVIELPEHKEILTLTALADTAHPTYFLIPDTVKRIDYIRYNNATLTETDLKYEDVGYKTPIEFQYFVNQRKESDSNITAYNDFNSGKLLIQTDKKPEFWTSFDDKYVVMDAYNVDIEATLQQSKLFCYGLKEPTWTHENSFVPDLDAHLFPLLFNEAKKQAFVELKQVTDSIAVERARSQLTRIHNNKHRHTKDRHARQPNYGRK